MARIGFKQLVRHSGQGMTEYIIIVALVAVAAIGVYMYFGQTVRHEVSNMALELSGQSGDDERKAAGAAANDASTSAKDSKGLGQYK